MVREALRGCLALLIAAHPARLLKPADPAPAHPGIPNLHEVAPGVARGGRPRAGGVEWLSDRGYRVIVNFQGRDHRRGLRKAIEHHQPGERASVIAEERREAEARGIEYRQLPFNSQRPLSPEDAANVWAAVRLMADAKNHPIFLHCEFGRDRTGLVVALFRVTVQRWSPLDAYAEWMRYGHVGWLTLKFTGNLDVFFENAVRDRMSDVEATQLRVMMKVSQPVGGDARAG